MKTVFFSPLEGLFGFVQIDVFLYYFLHTRRTCFNRHADIFHAGVKISDAVGQHNLEVGGVDWVAGFLLPGHITFNDGLFPTHDDQGRELNVRFKPPGLQGAPVDTVVWTPPISSQVVTKEVKATKKHPKRTNRFTSINIRPLGSGQTRKIPVTYRIEDFDTGLY